MWPGLTFPSVSPDIFPAGLGSSDAPGGPSPGWDPQYLLADAKPKEGLAQGCTLPETVF